MATPSLPFKHAKNHYEILAIAKYYFIRLGIDKLIPYPPLRCRPFERDLLQAAKNYQTVFKELQSTSVADTVVPAAPTRGPFAQFLKGGSQAAETSRKRSAPAALLEDRRMSLDDPSSLSGTPEPSIEPEEESDEKEENTRVEQYVALQNQEAALEDEIGAVDEEQADINAQLEELRLRRDRSEARKVDLQNDKTKVAEETETLLSALDPKERLRFGFQAGQMTERKRIKRG